MSVQDKPGQVIPDGYKKDARGCLIPLTLIKAADIARDELVVDLSQQAKALNVIISEFKEAIFKDIYDFVDNSADVYNVHIGGKKGNITLFSFDGKYKIQVAVAEHQVFDERLQAAKALIDECITDWSEGSRDEIKLLVQSAFQTDKEGRINTGRVLALRRVNITHPKWLTAMTAIGESLHVIGSKEYVRFFERVGDADEYLPISLNMAAV